MAFSLVWLPDVLERAGLKVALVDGWETRGRGDVGPIFGVICHHTAGSKTGNMGSLRILTNGWPTGPGVSALPGPLSQLGLGRDGTYYVIAVADGDDTVAESVESNNTKGRSISITAPPGS